MTEPSRVGFGFDTHRFSNEPQRRLILGGVTIEGHLGLEGHSDADVIVHAITDAVLGAAGLGDIGEHFSDTDDRWRGANSMQFLIAAKEMVANKGWSVLNADCTVVAEQPKLATYRSQMQQVLSDALQAPVSVKASRAEKMGALGRVEGIACWAVVLLAAH